VDEFAHVDGRRDRGKARKGRIVENLISGGVAI
jgi:hypothetical protein